MRWAPIIVMYVDTFQIILQLFNQEIIFRLLGSRHASGDALTVFIKNVFNTRTKVLLYYNGFCFKTVSN